MENPPSFPSLGPRSFKIIVVLPAYNEQENIGGLLESIARAAADDFLNYKVVVVDDGSTDQTAAILADFEKRVPLVVFRHVKNQGLGATIRDGLYAATKMAGPDDIIISMDADETHSPGLMASMVRKIKEGHDVVIASRYQPGAQVVGLALHRMWISSLASILFRAVFPPRGVRDYTCGFRAYRGTALRAALDRYGEKFIDQQGFQCMVDILLKMRRLPLVFGEVQMILRYDLKKGASKMRLVKTAATTLRLLALRRMGG